MAANIYEFFGYPAKDKSAEANAFRNEELCPFVDGKCIKRIQLDDTRRISGVCSIKPVQSGPVVTCPHRMYGGDYVILRHVSEMAFGMPLQLISGDKVNEQARVGEAIAVFGHRWGKELRLPKRKGKGSYFVDWILARLSAENELMDFTAVEVQTIDTTGNYREEFRCLSEGKQFEGSNSASPNWENVNKRILPQIIYKGHVLRREPKCSKGLFFVSPTPVYQRIRERLGGELGSIHPSSGSLTFIHYSLGETESNGQYKLEQAGSFTTTVDQVALAFTSPKDLPPSCSYEEAIVKALGS